MTPWLRFWFPHGDDAEHGAPPRDAALWSPEAIAQAQHDLWRHAAHATHDWWSYWRALWPALPMQLPTGVLTPPSPTAGEDAESPRRSAALAADEPAAERPRRPRVAAKAKAAASAGAPHRARHAGRGK